MRFQSLALLAGMVCAAVPCAHADDLFTLATEGATITFTLPSSPTISGTETTTQGFYLSSVPVTVNGTTSNEEIAFYSSASYGGLSIEDPNQGADSDGGTGLLIDQEGSQLFSGPVDSPTFIPGIYDTANVLGSEATDNGSFILSITDTSATPEPSSLALLGTGVLGLGGVLKRKWATR